MMRICGAFILVWVAGWVRKLFCYVWRCETPYMLFVGFDTGGVISLSKGYSREWNLRSTLPLAAETTRVDNLLELLAVPVESGNHAANPVIARTRAFG